MFRFFSRKPKRENYFILDIGTESVKALILEKKPACADRLTDKGNGGDFASLSFKEEKISVLGSSLEYYDRFSAFSAPRFEREVMKRAVLKAIAEIERQTGIKSKSVILGLPPNILTSRVAPQSFKRKKRGIVAEKEKEEILKEVFEQGKNKIARIYASEKGILPDDLQFFNVKILEAKIDGYAVPDILNYDGEDFDFRLLTYFLPKYYLETGFSGFFSPFPLVKELGFEISGIIAATEGLNLFLVQNPEAIFLDIGGEATQIFWAKNGSFEKISEFNKGAKDFSQVLSERLGLDEPSARDLKHRYAKGDISEESRQRIRGFFETTAQAWFKNLKDKLKEIGFCSFRNFSPDFLIFGGGALLPEIKEFLEEGNWEDVIFAGSPKVKILEPKNLIKIEQKIGLTVQSVPSLLICCAAISGKRGENPSFF